MMNMEDNAYFKIGNLNCTVICDEAGSNPPANVFIDVPPDQLARALEEHGFPPGEVPNSYNVLTIQSGSKRILVDTGLGKGTQWKDGRLLDGLQAQCIDPASVDVVVITHGDGDHVGGILTAVGQPVFPNAEYILLQEAWDFWCSPQAVSRLPEPRTAFGRKILPLIRERVRPCAAGEEFLPGFQLISVPGHRPGHSAISIRSNGDLLIHVADSIGNPLLLEHPDWHWGFDSDADRAGEDRRMLMRMAVEQKALVFCSHMPYPGVGHILAKGDAWVWQPLFEN
jgi:glyoxylase-like metal-dependent hydrolase (beta-lactamase superfamily II)